MKKWLTLSLALVAAAVTQAVTVAWTVPNTQYNDGNWMNVTTSNGKTTLGFDIYFVYSSEQLGMTSGKFDGDAAAEAAYNLAKEGVNGSTVVAGYAPTLNAPDTKLNAYGAGLLPSPGSDNLVDGSGYYYMVIVNKNPVGADPEYAVAGTNTVITFVDSEIGGNASKDGVFANNVGNAPNATDYFDMDGFLGGTWANAMTPEPTVLALLALGVAGVALRRKKNFTK